MQFKALCKIWIATPSVQITGKKLHWSKIDYYISNNQENHSSREFRFSSFLGNEVKNKITFIVYLYSSPRAAITEYRRLGHLAEMYFLTIVETRSPRPRFWQGWFLMRPVSLACKWLSFRHPHRAFFLCVSDVPSSSHEDTSCTGFGPHPDDPISPSLPL